MINSSRYRFKDNYNKKEQLIYKPFSRNTIIQTYLNGNNPPGVWFLPSRQINPTTVWQLWIPLDWKLCKFWFWPGLWPCRHIPLTKKALFLQNRRPLTLTVRHVVVVVAAEVRRIRNVECEKRKYKYGSIDSHWEWFGLLRTDYRSFINLVSPLSYTEVLSMGLDVWFICVYVLRGATEGPSV